MEGTATGMDRRRFLQVSLVGGVGLVVSCYAPLRARSRMPSAHAEDAHNQGLKPNAWLRIGTDDTVTVMVNHSEMGQGIMTALSMIVAEELEADWSKVRAEIAPVHPVYKNPDFGVQATGGSTSVRTSWDILRPAAAATRELLIAAAAKTWGVRTSECRAVKGTVVHDASGRTLQYGQLVKKAAGLPIPDNVPLKQPDRFEVIGKRFPRLDTPAKAEGSAVFGIDVKLPHMLVATVVRAPTLGGTLASFDPKMAKAVPGVDRVLPIPSGVAVVADTFWHAKKAAEALKVEWKPGKNAQLSSKQIATRWARLSGTVGDNIRDDGDVENALRKASKTIEAVYHLPYQAHACPEPMNCTAHVRKDGCDVWVPTQNQGGTQEIAAKLTGLDLDAVKVHTTYLGGGFGRRGDVDFVIEAVQISKAIGAPVKVMWTREDDIRNDHFRPAAYNVVRAGLNAQGVPMAWWHRMIAPSYMDWTIESVASAKMPQWLPRPLKNLAARAFIPVAKYKMSGGSAVGGAATMAYAIDNVRVEYIKDDPGVPVGAWRSVANSRNAFVVESFLDEIAAASGKDPYLLRYELLRNAPNRRSVLKLAAEKAGWGRKPPEGLFRGIAVHDFHDTAVAMVAEISIERGREIKVHRVVCGVHCGIVINPRTIERQIAGGIVFGLTATLKGEIRIKNGRSEQSNLDDFPLLRMDEMPKVDVYIVPSIQPPTGIGEVGVPPIAPAIANAVFAATGKRIRKLPINPDDLG